MLLKIMQVQFSLAIIVAAIRQELRGKGKNKGKGWILTSCGDYVCFVLLTTLYCISYGCLFW